MSWCFPLVLCITALCKSVSMLWGRLLLTGGLDRPMSRRRRRRRPRARCPGPCMRAMRAGGASSSGQSPPTVTTSDRSRPCRSILVAPPLRTSTASPPYSVNTANTHRSRTACQGASSLSPQPSHLSVTAHNSPPSPSPCSCACTPWMAV